MLVYLTIKLKKCGIDEIFGYILGSKPIFFVIYIAAMIVYNSLYSFYTLYSVIPCTSFVINSILFCLCSFAQLVLLIVFIVIVIKKWKKK